MIPCAAILVGGQGTRLQPVIGKTPKALAEIQGRPFIYYLLDQLQEAGVKMVVLCTGFGAPDIRKKLGDWYGHLKLVYSEETEPLGTGGALRNALPYFNSSSVLVLNGDSYVQTPLLKFVHWFQNQKIEAGMLVAHAHNAARFGQLQLSMGGQIASFSEKSPRGVTSWINAGIYLFSCRLLSTLPAKAFSLEQRIFPVWAEQNKLYAYQADAPFVDIGTPESFTEAQNFFGEPAYA